MGILNRLTRESLKAWVNDVERDEYDAFLDDVAEGGLREACSAREFTQQAMLNWIRDPAHPERRAKYDVALKAKSEILVHRTLETAAGADDPKLDIDTSFRVAKSWDRDRYGEQLKVAHTVAVRVDAGLTLAMGELLEKVVNGTFYPEQPPALIYDDVIENAPQPEDMVDAGGSLVPAETLSAAGGVEPVYGEI